MQTVDQIAWDIVRREGGYVNDPDDPGGATNFGVTIHTMRRLGLDMDGDGDIDSDDVKRLTAKDAVAIFKRHYFFDPNINLLPDLMQPSVFDMQVNSGNQASRILQRMINAYNKRLGWDLITVDGAIGPKTARAAKRVFEQTGQNMVDAYGISRRNYYFWLADRTPARRKYARTRAGGKGGWIKRAEGFISPRYHMSSSQFQQRVSKWA